MKLVPALICLTLFLTGCDRLSEVGKEPSFSPLGATSDASFVVSPARAALAVPPAPQIKQGYDRSSLWNSGPSSLFGDRRAQKSGDILTIVIEIDDQAQISNTTARSRSGSESVSVPNFLGIPQLLDKKLPDVSNGGSLADASSSSSSAGNGSVQRNEKITLRVAATVVDVLSNGHLVVQGNQEVRVNFELRDLRVAGIVRPEDISRRNEITYDKIAGARIAYGGRGQISDVQQPRIGQQIADIVLPF